ncbi:hypothetical protein COEREDRAFT_88502 [Coemansia reversa NRRL 1564]|uniref:Cation-transporting ATPase n=1 Tax=Coemansia reversa (strain ATCC 12441 / NRRL 1564) TaxID=763665 RepID=A0A2G5B6P9_COERN|nr:hypothetical protein COEREDRAFT_88502 [Coemansia reversa NRRL 1564]|eukprot:PIA14680.1 hypothetical protein COEREDRAFT_88502 [Coemansia reversa NRRL 1564]
MSDQNRDTSLQDVHISEDNMQLIIQGHSIFRLGQLTYWFLTFCTAGTFYILSRWFPVIRIRMSLRSAALESASFVHITSNGKHLSLEPVTNIEVNNSLVSGFDVSKEQCYDDHLGTTTRLNIFEFRHYRFAYVPALSCYVPISQWRDPSWVSGVPTSITGLDEEIIVQRRRLFGECVIDIQEKSYLRLLLDEAINPFYIFQAASIAIWCSEEYYYYSGAILLISAVSIASTLITTKQASRRIRETSVCVCPTLVLRENRWREVDSSQLVPGDIIDISLPGFKVFPCEAILLEGDCIVNESMLTGESVPESKVPLELNNNIFQSIDMAAHTFCPAVLRHILFAGTKLVRTRKTDSAYGGDVLMQRTTAMVIRTGFYTTKGALVRSILFPHPTRFRFYTDALRFVMVLAGLAIIGFIVNTINLRRLGVSTSEIVKKAFDLITIAVPPALPAAMTIGMVFAARRLRKVGIFCISPSRINVASKIAVVCFDKTGTLTEDMLDMTGVHLANQRSGGFLDMQRSAEPLFESLATTDTGSIIDAVGEPGISAIGAIATCHSLHVVDDALVGDPLEIEMLRFTGWRIDEVEDVSGSLPNFSDPLTMTPNHLYCKTVYPPSTLLGEKTNPHYSTGVRIIKCFEFAPELCRASVISKSPHAQNAEIYVKGAPEVLQGLCLIHTIPSDLDQVLARHAQSGSRVIAIAGKPLAMPLDKAALPERSEVECDLIFIGLLLFANKLKPATADVLSELHTAKIRTIMCTGDNPFTAVCVARECGMIGLDMHVFVSRLTPLPAFPLDNDKTLLGTSIETVNLHTPLTAVTWVDSEDACIVLNPVTLIPAPANIDDNAATERALKIAQTRKFCIAITGGVFGYLEKTAQGLETWKRLLMCGTVFARMSPEQKASLVKHLQNLGYISGFCGDGANDISALRTADVGISLSEAEASVAAPFTSRSADIQCVPAVIREGRCSIVTSFSCFKYMALYSIIQFTTCCMLYSYDINLTNGQFLYIDLFTILPIAVCIDRFPPAERLVSKRPSSRLTSKKVLASLLGNIMLVVVFQAVMFLMTEAQTWYHKPKPSIPGDADSTPNEGELNTSLYLLSSFQYLFIGVVFSIGPPYRKSALRSYSFVAVVVLGGGL